MKKTFLCVATLAMSFATYAQTQIYVSPTGNDRAKGEIRSPLKSIQAAISKAEECKDAKIEIILRGGEYPQSKSIEISKQAFTKEHSLTIKAAPAEEVRINGGLRLSSKMVRPVTNPEVLSRLQPEFSAKIREIDLNKTDVALHQIRPSGFGRPSLPSWSEIFVDDQPMTLSRWPNDSMALIGKIVVAGNDKDKEEGNLPIFQYNTSRPERWSKASNIWLGGYFGHGYADDMIPVKKINTADSTIHMDAFTTYHFMTGASFRQWYALNLLEEIDRPGEYVIDIENRKFYFYPRNEKVGSVQLSVLDQPLLAIENNSNIKVEGIIFEASRGIGVYLENTENVLIDGCTFRNLGNVAVCMGKGTLAPANITVKPHAAEAGGSDAPRMLGDVMGKLYDDILYFRNGGHNNGVVNCYIDNVGAGGVNMSGGDRKTLTRGNNFVENCKISNYNRIERSYRPGIWIDGVGNRVSKCDIFNAPSMAILFHGNDQVIELCKITNVCTEVDDQGAIYYGRDASERGHVIRYCYFKELSPKHRVTATYHDDGACGSEVYGNIYHRAGSIPVLIGGGQDNNYHGNIFIDVPVAIHIDNRMQGWGKFMVQRGAIIDQRLQTVNYLQPPYSTAYPELTEYWNTDPSLPQRNKVYSNLFYKVRNIQSGESHWGEWWNNWLTNQDPGFVDPENPLKGFRQGAEVFNRIKDFPNIPFAEIGSSLK